jgi:hypothetical protein
LIELAVTGRQDSFLRAEFRLGIVEEIGRQTVEDCIRVPQLKFFNRYQEEW